MELLGSPAARVPGDPPHRHQRQDVGGPDDRARCSRPRGLSIGHVHEPAPRSGSTSASPGTASRSPTTTLDELLARGRRGRGPPARRARATSRSSPPPRSRWFGDVAVDVAVVEVGLGRHRGTPPTWSTADVAVVTNVSIDHVEYIGPTRGGHRGGEGRDREAGRDARARRDRSRRSCRSSWPASPARSCVRDRRLRRARRTALAHRRPRASTCSRRTRSYDEVFLVAARRAPGRQRGDRARRGRVLPRTRRSTTTLVADAFARRATRRVGSRSSGTSRSSLLDGAKNVAGAHALRAALAEEFADSPRTLVVGLLREKEPHEMLEALGVRDAARLVCCRPPTARAARSRGGRRRGATTSASTRDRVDVDRRRAPTRSATRSTARAADGQVVVTGSLYVVGAARRAPSRRLSPTIARAGRGVRASLRRP